MKKNTMMRIAAILLVCVLASTCGISGTFAKYVTSDAAQDYARVAKFGVVVTGKVDNATTQGNNVMFVDNYDDTVITTEAQTAVVAPGTDGKMSDFTITGTPEVKVTVSYNAVVELGNNWLDENGKYYCPLVITITGLSGDRTLCGLDFDSADKFEEEIAKIVAEYSRTYEPNTNLAGKSAEYLTISWAWAFAGQNYGGVGHVKQTDVSDTWLGDKAANGKPATILVKVTCTVTQVD